MKYNAFGAELDRNGYAPQHFAAGRTLPHVRRTLHI